MGRRVPAGIFVILALGGVGLVGWLMLRPARKPFATLPNGVRVKVEAVTFGTNHLFTTDSKLTRTLRRMLPGSLQRLLPAAYTSTQTTTEPQALIYLSTFDPRAGAHVSAKWDRFDMVDEHGCIWPVHQWGTDSRAPSFGV